MKEKKVYLALGSNLGNTEKNIEAALNLLEKEPEITLLKKSSYWQTEPQGDKNQAWYTNIVAVILCNNLYPYILLEKIQKIEYLLGRERIEGNRNAPRTLDIDILDFENVKSYDEKLILPHPRMFSRAFVLVPLAEIEADYSYNNQNIQEYLKEIDYKIEGKKIFQK